jgi:Stress responsive A/B Barrel Domain
MKVPDLKRGHSVFRQVVAIRWAGDVSEDAKQGYRDALDALRGIPELVGLTWGDDARHFDGNFDFVAVMDFADFASARRYVEHPLHQTYVLDHASKVVGERVIVQHDWSATPAASSQ